MRVLHLSPSFPPEFRGGVERYVETLCPALEARGVRCAVLAGSDVRSARAGEGELVRERAGSIDVYRARRAAGDEHAVDLVHPSLEGRIDEAVRDFAPDVAHVHHWLNLGGGLVRRLRALGVPSVVTLHDAWATCPRFNRVVDGRFCERPLGPEACVPCLAPLRPGGTQSLAEELVARDLGVRLELACAARVLVPSAAARDLIARWLPGAATPEVLPSGAPELRPLAPYEAPRPEERARVGTFGSVVPEKGVHLLLDAATRLAERRALELHVHGNLPDAAYARRLRDADARGLLRLHGAYAPADLPRIARGWHVAVFASVCSESWSLALDEALALGLPVVVAARGALGERVGTRGASVAPEDPAALAAALGELLDAPARLRRMAAEPREPRGVRDVAADLEALYASAAGGPRAGAEAEAEAALRASLYGRGRPDARAATLDELAAHLDGHRARRRAARAAESG